MMQYPSRAAYQDAMFNSGVVLVDRALKAGSVKQGKDGLPLTASGGFSTVFRTHTGGKEWAIRCFNANIGDAAAIYAAISKHLQLIQSPYFVGFEFQNDGIWMGKTKYPIVKMEWVDGDLLKGFVQKHLRDPHMILALAEAWRRMLASLATARIAHGDLQHENLVISAGSNGLEIRLIDYDTVVVPEIEGWTERNAGYPEYQHPCRRDLTQKHLTVDNFSALVIHASLLALGKKPALWKDFQIETSSGLLFEQSDFTKPQSARAFTVLRDLGGECARLGEALTEACLSKDPLRAPRIDEVLGAAAPAPQQQPSKWWGMPPAQALHPGPAARSIQPLMTQSGAPSANGPDWWRTGATPTPTPAATSPFARLTLAPTPKPIPVSAGSPSVWTVHPASTSQVFHPPTPPVPSASASPSAMPSTSTPTPTPRGYSVFGTPSPSRPPFIPTPPGSQQAKPVNSVPQRQWLAPRTRVAAIFLMLAGGMGAVLVLPSGRRSDNPVLPPSLSVGEGCVHNVECGAGLLCLAGRCAPYEITTPSSSSPSSPAATSEPALIAESPGDGCTRDAECASYLRCVTGVCAWKHGVIAQCGRFIRCRVRDEPGSSGAILETCYKRAGDDLAVLSRVGAYLRIACSGGRSGYIQEQFVTLD